MLEALIQGKLSREQENLEDVLTSIVFGIFRRAGDPTAVLKFLTMSEPVQGYSPLTADVEEFSTSYESYEFWPQWEEENNVAFAEPDVVIEIYLAGGSFVKILVGVEAKLWSGKSSFSTDGPLITDQLAKQWMHLQRRASNKGAIPWLVYLTADYSAPTEDIFDAVNELQRKAGINGKYDCSISWLSWRRLSDIKDEWQVDPTVHCWEELQAVTSRLGLSFFRGFRVYEILQRSDYCFATETSQYYWDLLPLRRMNWRYSKL